MKEIIATIKSEVIHGKGMGHKHGMPTANQELGDNEVEFGVYGGVATVHGDKFLCITNIGLRPSADNNMKANVETLILDFSEDIYGQILQIDLYEYLRPIQKFEGGLDELKLQLDKDANNTRELLKDMI